MAPFTDAGQVEAALEALANRPSGALVRRLAREPGRRESRYAHLFGTDRATIGSAEIATAPESSGAAAPSATPPPSAAPAPSAATPADPQFSLQAQRLAALETEVRALREDVEQLKRRG
jgi:uncharacterized protein YceH (UPF0502 family)